MDESTVFGNHNKADDDDLVARKWTPSTKVLTWSDAVGFIDRAMYHKLRRTAESHKRYLEFKASLRESHWSLNDYLRGKLFGYEMVSREGKMAAISPQLVGHQVVIAPNDFEYNFSSEVSHYIIWFESKDDLCAKAVESKIEGSFLGKANDIRWWVNPVSMRSVPGLAHCHVLAQGISSA